MAFPWDAALHAGLHRLRLSAKDFWAMTPRELHAAVGGLAPSAGRPDRRRLAVLMREFPD